jgi:chromate transporter
MKEEMNNETRPAMRLEYGQALGYTLWQLVGYMLRLGTLGFGGPVALAGYMHRDLVGKRGWITEDDYREGLARAQLAPGPMATQLAIYLGYVHYRILGATLVGVAFVIPSLLRVVALGWAYVRYGGLTWMQSVFYGVGAAVLGIIAMSAYKLTAKSVGRTNCSAPCSCSWPSSRWCPNQKLPGCSSQRAWL